MLNTNSRPRGNAFKFKKHGTGIRATSFRQRVINPWNNLPPITNLSPLSAFKRSKTNVDFTNGLKR